MKKKKTELSSVKSIQLGLRKVVGHDLPTA